MILKTKAFVVFFILSATTFNAQNNSFLKKSDTLNTKRRNAVIISESVLATGTLFALNELWYKDYPRTSFQFKNDNNDWKQMDKAGHLMTSYYIGKVGMEVLDWSGVSKKKQLIYGATLGFSFLTAVEILDGFSKQWGASIGDVLANAAGTGILVGQELLWQEQRITVKYSFHQTKFANCLDKVIRFPLGIQVKSEKIAFVFDTKSSSLLVNFPFDHLITLRCDPAPLLPIRATPIYQPI